MEWDERQPPHRCLWQSYFSSPCNAIDFIGSNWYLSDHRDVPRLSRTQIIRRTLTLWPVAVGSAEEIA